MDSASDSPSFSNHVLGQLHEMSHQVAMRGRGNRGRGRGQARSGSPWSQPQQSHNPHAQQQQQQPPASFNVTSDSFPPLGSQPPSAPRSVASSRSEPQYPPAPQYQPEPQYTIFNDTRHGTPREYQERARGNYRGSRPFITQQHHPLQTSQHPSQPLNTPQYHTNGRSQPRHGQLYNPHAGMHHGTPHQQRAMRHLIMKQSDYLTGIGKKAYDEYKFTQEEKDLKENFRLDLEKTARNALYVNYPDLQLDQIKLKCYGSLANGFALKNCDMDLLLSLPEYREPVPDKPAMAVSPDGEHVEVSDDGEEEHGFMADVQRILEKAFLDHEYGARLLTQTRVPILRICQSPTSELLINLRMERMEWEKAMKHTGVAQDALQESEVPVAELDAVEQAVTDLSITTKAAPAKRGNRGNAGLEFTDDCGIQCDINFSNFVALHNSTLLRLYHGFDTRVKEIGIFVKIWAKTRDINTPYRGTLSSYGWILMVLHYLMNITTPAVIPNLQYLAKIEDSWNPDRQIDLFEGFDVRFVQDHQGLEEIQQEMSANRNRESAGQLLRGFFQYYATNQGFHWTRDIISIRTKGGIIPKQAKGWTEAKWQQSQKKSVRNRYLLAIEDPFEVEHNIARTVGHHGIVTIRNEFRRAWSIIEKIGTDEEVPADEFLNPVTDRVDTLKKDLDAYKQRQVQLRQEVEAKEKAMLQQGEAEKSELQNAGTWEDSDQGNAQTYSSPKSGRESSDPKLTSAPPAQVPKQSKPSASWRRRKVTVDSDDEDQNDGSPEAEARPNKTIMSSPEAQAELKKRNEGLTSREEVLLASGYDHWGNPVAWDIETQEGRWLQWRDQKKRSGDFRGFSDPRLLELDEQYPFDDRRPNPYVGKPYHNGWERKEYERPPWPATNPNQTNNSVPAIEDNNCTGHKTSVLPEKAGQCQRESVLARDALTTEVASRDADLAEQIQTTPEEEQPSTPQTYALSNVVGELIPWDSNTRGGRWLRWRDSIIRQGTWKTHQNSKYAKIDRQFLYDPEMTWAELEEKNQLLREYYKITLIPPKPRKGLSKRAAARSSEPEICEQVSSSGAGSRATAESRKLSSQGTITDEHDVALQHTPSLVGSSTLLRDQSPNAMPGSDGRPSQDTASDKAPTTPSTDERVPDVDFLRLQRLAFFTKHSTPSRSEVDTNDHFSSPVTGTDLVEPANKALQTPIPSHRNTVPAHVRKATLSNNASAEQGTELPHGKASNAMNQTANDFSDLSMEISDSPIKADDISLRVPATLYPGVADSKRPRDKNPNVMPIPRAIGFQFDPRQLQDLAIISKGGNGCAREGAQFNLEEDEYEWGGGGAMGYKTSTGPQVGAVSSGHTPYEAGKGDEEGLLDELPRNWDKCTTTSL